MTVFTDDELKTMTFGDIQKATRSISSLTPGWREWVRGLRNDWCRVHGKRQRY